MGQLLLDLRRRLRRTETRPLLAKFESLKYQDQVCVYGIYFLPAGVGAFNFSVRGRELQFMRERAANLL